MFWLGPFSARQKSSKTWAGEAAPSKVNICPQGKVTPYPHQVTFTYEVAILSLLEMIPKQ